MAVPENHIVAEGRSLKAALEAASTQLQVPVGRIEHKIDLSHFRSSMGMGVGSDTVKIFAWARAAADTAASEAAEAWAKELLEKMNLQGSVRASQNGSNVSVLLDAGEASRYLVGKRGATLKALQHLLEGNLKAAFADKTFYVDVAGGSREDDRGERRDDRGDRGDRGERRPDRGDRGERRPDRGDRGDRGDRRPDRGDRGERRPDRGDRGDRRPDRGDRGDRGGRRREQEDEDLKKLARKLGQKVLASGQPEVIRRDLNSYDRRIVHMEIANIPGLQTRSIGEGHERRVEILPAQGGSGEE